MWKTYEMHICFTHGPDLFIRVQAMSSDHARRIAEAQYPDGRIVCTTVV